MNLPEYCKIPESTKIGIVWIVIIRSMIDLDFNFNFGKRRVISILILIWKSRALPFLWSNVNRTVAILSCGLNTDHRTVQSRTRYRELWESRFAWESLRLPTSEQLVQPRVCPSCRRKILARFLKPGPDRKLRLVPTKPCYLSFPTSLVDPRTENVLRRIFFLERGALQFCNRSCIPLSYLSIYRGCLVRLAFERIKWTKCEINAIC